MKVGLIRCMQTEDKGNPIGFACPHVEQMKNAISKKVGDSIKIIDYTH